MLLYNAQTGNSLEVDQEPILSQIQQELQNFDNLYSFQLDELHCRRYRLFLDKLIEGGFGDRSGTSYPERRVSYPPILKLNHGISSIRVDHEQGQAGYILDYLHEVTIYLSGSLYQEEPFYYKQTIYPVKTDQRLNREKLLKWLRTIRGGALQVVNILCAPQIIEEYNELLNLLKELKVKINYYIHYTDLSDIKIPTQWLAVCNLVVIYEKEGLQQIQNAYDGVCIVTDAHELPLIEKYLSGDKQITIVPIYTYENRLFFEQNIFTTKNELLAMRLSKKEIFTRMEINTNFFGKLTVLPTGEIYSNLNVPALGSITDSLYDILFNELDSNRAWRKVRDCLPCSDCRFRWMCPPISNYEFVLNAYNLCTVEEADR